MSPRYARQYTFLYTNLTQRFKMRKFETYKDLSLIEHARREVEGGGEGIIGNEAVYIILNLFLALC